MGKGDFIIVPSSFSHYLATKKEKNCFYWFATNDEWLIHTFSIAGYSKNEVMRGYTDCAQTVTDILEKTIYRFPKDCDSRIYMMSRFTCLLSYLSSYAAKTQKISEQLLLRCISHIETSYGALNVDDLAKRFFVSRRYLYAIFKEYKNVSPIEYIISVRMKAADKFLLTTDYSIAKIAELTGYSSYNQFTRAYKEYYAMQPSKKRELLKSHYLATQNQE
ncbi:MAG: helix-turn-helix transcriptional regulator [Clostridia bacterium]|nr:helix-turn-helix transcriptional regulator [Clostridia bacterium]